MATHEQGCWVDALTDLLRLALRLATGLNRLRLGFKRVGKIQAACLIEPAAAVPRGRLGATEARVLLLRLAV